MRRTDVRHFLIAPDEFKNACFTLKTQQMLPPPHSFLTFFFFLAQKAIARLGENKRARAGAGSE